MPNRQRFALRAQAAYYIATGAWPLLSRRAFEAITGHKKDWWLVQMVGSLAFTNGIAIGIGARREYASQETLFLSTLSALSFVGIDTVYALAGRISPIYLADAVLELGFILAVIRR